MIRLTRTVTAVVCVLLLLMDSAWAYLDPGTGSLIVQSLIAGVAGALVAGRFYWAKCKSFLVSKFSRNAEQADIADASSDAEEERDVEST